MKYPLRSSKKPVLVEATRTDRREAAHIVHAVCCNDSGEVLGYFGDTEYMTYLRSSVKPIQLLNALILRPSLINECSDSELAVLAASHSGEPGHLAALEGIQERYGLWEELLLCGTHDPYWAPANWGYGKIERPITSIHCNCSGKHTAMLLACQAQGWPLETYNQPDHPMQKANTEKIAEYIGRIPETVEYGVDGCSVPTWWVPIREAATIFARFSSPKYPHTDFEKKAIDRIFEAFHKASWYMSGTGRFCDPFNRESDGEWLGKIGGEGIYIVSFKNMGIGIAAKVVDGNSRAIPPALLHVMKIWGLIDENQLQRLSNWVRVERRNSPGEIIGYMQVVGK